MPTVRVTPDLEMHYLVDDYTDPWSNPEAILLLHGIFESSAVWFGWVPHLARHFRVVRPDMRGFGASTPMPRDFPWSLDIIIDDFVSLMQTLGIERFHLIGAKAGATVASRFAARFPGRVHTLILAGAPPPGRDTLVARAAAWTKQIEEEGVESLARSSMAGRLGSRFPLQGVEWWAKLMGRSAAPTVIGSILGVPSSDISPDLPRIVCPTLVITTEGSALGSVVETRAWQKRIPRSTLLVLPGDSYHVAASDPDRCARETLDFISRARAAAD